MGVKKFLKDLYALENENIKLAKSQYYYSCLKLSINVFLFCYHEYLDENFLLLHKIENSNEVIGIKLKINQKYILPFEEILEELFEYICKEIIGKNNKNYSALSKAEFKKMLEKKWESPFVFEEIKNIFVEYKNLEKNINKLKQQQQDCNDFILDLRQDIKVLTSLSAALELSILNFLLKKNIWAKKLKNNQSGADLYFQIEDKFVVVKIKGDKKK